MSVTGPDFNSDLSNIQAVGIPLRGLATLPLLPIKEEVVKKYNILLCQLQYNTILMPVPRQCNILRRYYSRSIFFNLIPRLWNSLPSININFPTIKSHLRHLFRNHFIPTSIFCSYYYLCPCQKYCKLHLMQIMYMFVSYKLLNFVFTLQGVVAEQY